MFNSKKMLAIAIAALAIMPGGRLQAWWAHNGGLNSDLSFKPFTSNRKSLNSDSRYSFVSGLGVEFMVNPEGRDYKGKKAGAFEFLSPINSDGNHYESYYRRVGQYQNALSNTEKNKILTLNNGQDLQTAGLVESEKLDQLAIKGDRTENSLNFYSTISAEFDDVTGTFYLTSYMPFKLVSVSNASVSPLAKSSDEEKEFLSDQAMIKNMLLDGLALETTPMVQNVKVGDFQVMLGWKNRFLQDNQHLKAVDVDLAIGMIFPLSDQVKDKNLFETVSGSDGAFGVPLKAKLQAEIQDRFLLTGLFDFIVFLDHTGTKRLRKEGTDSEKILDKPVRVRIDPGQFMRLQGRGTVISPCKCYWASVGYEYGRKTDSKVLTNDKSYSLLADSFPASEVNAAQQWKEADYHNLLLNAGIDFENKSERLSPRLQAFARIPLQGKRINLFKSFGFEMTLHF